MLLQTLMRTTIVGFAHRHGWHRCHYYCMAKYGAWLMGEPPPDRMTAGQDWMQPTVLPALALLTRQPALIAVMVQVTVADAVYEVTVSKAID